MEVYLLRFVLFISVAGYGNAEYKKPLTFKCYEDWCNLDSAHQFCSEKFRFCRNCEEIKDDCGSASQPLNCTGYCIAVAVKEALEDNVGKEPSCYLVPMMLTIANGAVTSSSQSSSYAAVGSNLTYTCNEGFVLQGSGTIMCVGNGTWNQVLMPYCLDNACLDYKRATIGLSVTGVVCILGSGMVVCMFCRKLRKLKRYISMSSSPKNEELPLMTKPDEDDNSAASVEIPPPRTRTESGGNTEDTGTSFKSPTPSTFCDKSDTKKKDATGENNESNCSSQTQRVPDINVKLNVFLQNEVQQSVSSSPERPPETSENVPDQRKDRVPFGQISTKRKSTNEKLPTEKSREISPHEETDEGNKDKGTKPLPARDDKYKHSQETVKEQEKNGPEALPAEDIDLQMPASETSQGNLTKKVGFNDITFPKL